MSSKAVIVSIALGNETLPVGRLWFHTQKGKESASFEYTQEWLKHKERFALEPALALTEGAFHTRARVSLFGSLGDSAPDRWGRMLIQRSQLIKAQASPNAYSSLSELDYVLGVSDEARQGALRFSLPSKEKIFLAAPKKAAIPPLVELPKLLSATEHFIDQDECTDDLRLLLAPGSSLGGARPKASVRAHDGTLAIAKFPRKDDEINVVLWEAVALTLAQNAGIRVPSWSLETVLNKPVLIIKRFDRNLNHRIPFLSAMSMLEARDNEQRSYLEIVDALNQYGAMPTNDMEELWRRIVLTIMISNTDDHLRNHGFIYERYQGWRLSPVYDINPTPMHIKPKVLTTAIDLDNTQASLETAIAVAQEFRVSVKRADLIINEVKSAVKEWRNVATRMGLTQSECTDMASAFNVG